MTRLHEIWREASKVQTNQKTARVVTMHRRFFTCAASSLASSFLSQQATNMHLHSPFYMRFTRLQSTLPYACKHDLACSKHLPLVTSTAKKLAVTSYWYVQYDTIFVWMTGFWRFPLLNGTACAERLLMHTTNVIHPYRLCLYRSRLLFFSNRSR